MSESLCPSCTRVGACVALTYLSDAGTQQNPNEALGLVRGSQKLAGKNSCPNKFEVDDEARNIIGNIIYSSDRAVAESSSRSGCLPIVLLGLPQVLNNVVVFAQQWRQG